MQNITVPVVFCFFNRKDRIMKVFERIRRARPKYIYLLSDGPRTEVTGECEMVAGIRKEIESLIDWTDNVEIDYANENMGCGPRLATGIESALSKYGKAMILEDDCLPTDSFFPYQQYLLNRYEKDEKIACVSGTYFLKKKNTPLAYGFTHFPQIWGWGTWARAWEGYSYTMDDWSDDFLTQIEEEKSIPSFAREAWARCFEGIKRGIKENPRFTWDIQFWFNCLRKRTLSIFPYRNQVTNFGYVKDATHTTSWWFCNKPQYETDWNMEVFGGIDLEYERWLQNRFYGGRFTWAGFYYSILLWLKIRERRILSRYFSR